MLIYIQNTGWKYYLREMKHTAHSFNASRGEPMLSNEGHRTRSEPAILSSPFPSLVQMRSFSVIQRITP